VQTNRAFLGRVGILNRDSILIEEHPEAFAKANGFRMIADDKVAVNPAVHFRIETFLPAGLEGVTPHVLKHTAISWAIMAGLGVVDAAEFFDTSPQTLRKAYWHHSPYHQERALAVVERRP
jgi:integrase